MNTSHCPSAANDALDCDLRAAGATASLFVARDRLAVELQRLDRLHCAARSNPRRFGRAIQGRHNAVALWLYGVAVGVAAHGLHDTALALLDVLPGIAAGAHGRRELLCDLIAENGTHPLLLTA